MDAFKAQNLDSSKCYASKLMMSKSQIIFITPILLVGGACTIIVIWAVFPTIYGDSLYNIIE